MVILGIDPGTASMGYGIIEIGKKDISLADQGVIKTKPDMDMPKRLGVLYASLNDVIRRHQIDLMVIESLFFNTNAKTAISVGQARGVCMLVAAHNNIDVTEYTALQAKRVLTGYGRADKVDMQNAVKRTLGLSQVIKPDDANDGVAMALCYYLLGYKKK